jgi:lambda repressor-like predicted transcriptional regulator
MGKNQMKKSEWIYLANAMWTYAEKHDGKISSLLKELIKNINKNMEVIIDDMGTNGKVIRSERYSNTNATDKNDRKRS